MKLTKEIMDKIAKIFNENFCEPFMKEDEVLVYVLSENEYNGEGPSKVENPDEKYILSINIGSRDIQIDENFEIISSGSMLGSEEPSMKLTKKDMEKMIETINEWFCDGKVFAYLNKPSDFDPEPGQRKEDIVDDEWFLYLEINDRQVTFNDEWDVISAGPVRAEPLEEDDKVAVEDEEKNK